MSRALRLLSILGLALLLQESRALASDYPLANILPKDAAEKLAKAGVNTSDQLLEQGATPAGRTKLAKASGLAAKQLLEWVRMSDVLRIKGVGPLMVRLLNAAGVVSIAQLKQRNAKNLHEKLIAANDKAKITEKPPSDKQVENWIEQAKALKTVVK